MTPAAATTSAPATSLPATSLPATALPASSASTTSLLQAYLKARDLPAGTVTGVRPGSVHVAETAGGTTRWATAAFLPARGLPESVSVRLQDGGDSGIFESAAGNSWHLAQVGVEPLACDKTLPATVRSAWHLAPQVACGTAAAKQDSKASAARASLRAASSKAGAKASAAGSTAGAGAAGSTASTGKASGGTVPNGATIASIALSQVGVSDIPDVTSFDTVDCDPYTAMVGPWYPDPDSRGCGYNTRFGVEDESEEWCADFAEFVWLHAGVTQDMDLINPGANSFYNWGLAQGESLTVDGTDPQVGDAVVLYPPGTVTTTSSADHVGIVTAVNSDGTINVVDGDFLGSTNISVQYDTDVTMSTWAAQVEDSPGEQWVFVAPPTTPQPASPTVQISGPAVAAAGAPASFSAQATEPGGSISSYAWAFGDGEYEPNGAASGQSAQHVFADTGRQTVSLIATSNLGTITVKTLNVDVVSSSAPVVSTPSDALYYAWTPVAQTVFQTLPSGGVAEDLWDGASWLREDLPANIAVAPGSPLTSLQYKDSSSDVYEPHVFARSSSGGLLEASEAGGTWSSQSLPATVGRTSPIVATTVALPPSAAASSSTPSYPAVFSYSASGSLDETYRDSGRWKMVKLPAPAAGGDGLAVATAFEGGTPVVEVYSAGPNGSLVVTSQRPGGGWQSAVIPSSLQLAPRSQLAAVSSGAGGAAPAVFFTDSAGDLAEAASANGGLTWSVQQVSATPVLASAGLQATNFVPASGGPYPEVFAVSASGQPVEADQSSGSWVTQVLPGTATSLVGLTDYAVPSSPQGVLFSSSAGVEQDSDAAGSWALTGPLPDTPVTFAGQIVLYAATSADYQSAEQAASFAGLPASDVTGSFATAWDAGLSGNYLVIGVGLAAADGLYFNVCGWTNPSDAFAGSTPFFLVNPPISQLPGPDNFEEAAGATQSGTTQIAEDLAYYALNGQLPPGVTTLPTEAALEFTCSGEPSL